MTDKKPVMVVLALLLLMAEQSWITTHQPCVAAARQARGPSLRRVEFRAMNVSCIACLRRIAGSFQKAKGVLKADISIYRPYWGVVIYNKNETTFEKLTKECTRGESVKIVDVEEKSIDKVPVLIIPKTPAADR
jgi:hypothetical protein